ncbi:MAG: hypothetical protein ACOX6L_01780 [Syntrophomonadaceae bacterium]|jgi:hypothetical protein
MTELQQAFLFYTFVYFLAKGAICVAFYIATVIIEKHARQKHAMLKIYLKKKRQDEAVRWAGAYSQYNRKCQQLEQAS